jgi:hypothetical protein
MLPADALLQIWEHGQRGSAAERSLQLLALALPGHDRDALAAVDLAQRDWHLLQLRRRWFGPALAGYAECPSCGERLEIEFSAAALPDTCPPDPPVFVTHDGRRFRLPTLGDLVAVSGAAAADAAFTLFERCALDGADRRDLPAVRDEVDDGLASLAAERGIYLELSCTRCAQQSRHALDPAEYLWNEIAAAAAALLEDVHLLASCYGWPERDILAMGATRRQAYIDRALS